MSRLERTKTDIDVGTKECDPKLSTILLTTLGTEVQRLDFQRNSKDLNLINIKTENGNMDITRNVALLVEGLRQEIMFIRLRDNEFHTAIHNFSLHGGGYIEE